MLFFLSFVYTEIIKFNNPVAISPSDNLFLTLADDELTVNKTQSNSFNIKPTSAGAYTLVHNDGKALCVSNESLAVCEKAFKDSAFRLESVGQGKFNIAVGKKAPSDSKKKKCLSFDKKESKIVVALCNQGPEQKFEILENEESENDEDTKNTDSAPECPIKPKKASQNNSSNSSPQEQQACYKNYQKNESTPAKNTSSQNDNSSCPIQKTDATQNYGSNPSSQEQQTCSSKSQKNDSMPSKNNCSAQPQVNQQQFSNNMSSKQIPTQQCELPPKQYSQSQSMPLKKGPNSACQINSQQNAAPLNQVQPQQNVAPLNQAQPQPQQNVSPICNSAVSKQIAPQNTTPRAQVPQACISKPTVVNNNYAPTPVSVQAAPSIKCSVPATNPPGFFGRVSQLMKSHLASAGTSSYGWTMNLNSAPAQECSLKANNVDSQIIASVAPKIVYNAASIPQNSTTTVCENSTETAPQQNIQYIIEDTPAKPIESANVQYVTYEPTEAVVPQTVEYVQETPASQTYSQKVEYVQEAPASQTQTQNVEYVIAEPTPVVQEQKYIVVPESTPETQYIQSEIIPQPQSNTVVMNVPAQQNSSSLATVCDVTAPQKVQYAQVEYVQASPGVATYDQGSSVSTNAIAQNECVFTPGTTSVVSNDNGAMADIESQIISSGNTVVESGRPSMIEVKNVQKEIKPTFVTVKPESVNVIVERKAQIVEPKPVVMAKKTYAVAAEPVVAPVKNEVCVQEMPIKPVTPVVEKFAKIQPQVVVESKPQVVVKQEIPVKVKRSFPQQITKQSVQPQQIVSPVVKPVVVQQQPITPVRRTVFVQQQAVAPVPKPVVVQQQQSIAPTNVTVQPQQQQQAVNYAPLQTSFQSQNQPIPTNQSCQVDQKQPESSFVQQNIAQNNSTQCELQSQSKQMPQNNQQQVQSPQNSCAAGCQ